MAATVQSDEQLLDLLRECGPQSVSQLIAAMQVTATAVRQRLVRLIRRGMIEREAAKTGRGRPSHRYRLTEKARRQAGSNFGDLTIALWQEVRHIKDAEVRQGLLTRLAGAMANLYRGRVGSGETGSRMDSIVELMAERGVPFSAAVNPATQLPVLTAHACPYPDLAEQDRGICAVENMMFSELLGQKVRLSECRLDGAACCRFETN